jgi:hypothetical protein
MGTCFCQTGRYKEHFVCLECRKMFKKPAYFCLPEKERPATFEEYRPPCPQCGQPMHNMGKEFKAPRQKDTKAWAAVRRNLSKIRAASMTLPRRRTGPATR